MAAVLHSCAQSSGHVSSRTDFFKLSGSTIQDSTRVMRDTIVEGSTLILTTWDSSMCAQSTVHKCFVGEMKGGCCDRESNQQPCAQQQNPTVATQVVGKPGTRASKMAHLYWWQNACFKECHVTDSLSAHLTAKCC